MNKTILVALAAGCASLAQAQDSFYTVEALLGQSTQVVITEEGSAFSYGIRGTYHFVDHFGLEASYQNYGEAGWEYVDSFGDTINETTKSSALTAGAKGVFFNNSGFSLNVRGGLMRWNTEVIVTDTAFPGEEFTGKASGTAFYYGVGATYAFTENLFVGAEYTVATLDAKLDGDLDGAEAEVELSSITGSIGYKF